MIINSLLDTDYYKLTMMQVVLHQYAGTMVELTFHCRSEGIDLTPFAQEIKTEIQHLCQLRFSQDELKYLKQFSIFKSDFLDYLKIFQFNIEHVDVDIQNGFSLTIKGPWLQTILFEVPLLAIISEIYNRNVFPNTDLNHAREVLLEKCQRLTDSSVGSQFKLSDFGTRRRHSFAWHQEVDKILTQELPNNFIGTSNVLLAKENRIQPIGTMAHEYFQAFQGFECQVLHSQKLALQKWQEEYRGDLAIALTDTYGINAFLKDFDLYFAKLYDGVRHDSGDPFDWGEMMLEHYEKLRIDTNTKKLVFSDSLTFGLAIELFQRFKDRAQILFGIGTKLTNDMGNEPIQIVIKMTECNGHVVAKISDSPGKTMCKDEVYLQYLQHIFS